MPGSVPVTGSPSLSCGARQPRSQLRFVRRLVGVTGVEPVTLRLSSACSNQLSYTPWPFSIYDFGFTRPATLQWPDVNRKSSIVNVLVELRRLELLTYSLQSYRS